MSRTQELPYAVWEHFDGQSQIVAQFFSARHARIAAEALAKAEPQDHWAVTDAEGTLIWPLDEMDHAMSMDIDDLPF